MAPDTLLERQPTGRVGKPEDLAGLIIFLSTLAGAHSVGESTFSSLLMSLRSARLLISSQAMSLSLMVAQHVLDGGQARKAAGCRKTFEAGYRHSTQAYPRQFLQLFGDLGTISSSELSQSTSTCPCGIRDSLFGGRL
jgi:hypothetical protein